MLLDLDQISESHLPHVGGKALGLARIRRSGMTVPRSFCLTTEGYELFLDQGRLRPVIQQELGRKSFADMRWEELWDAALRIRNHLMRTPVPARIVDAVGARLSSEFAGRPIAVRSSAPGEDSDRASFAGLHDSFVGLVGLQDTIEAIRGVWASLWTDRALLYRRELGIDVHSSAMAVLIQELVEGVSSGVAFGVHPTSPGQVAIEAVYGLNQGLVDGTIEPDRWAIDRETGSVVEHVAPTKRQRLVVRPSGSVVEAVPVRESQSPPLDDADRQRVFDAVLAAEELFGKPQDIEWTLTGDGLVMLQSRPLTTSGSGTGDKRAWYLSLTRSLENLRVLRDRVEHELLPAMDREADEIANLDLRSLDDAALSKEVDRRREAHDRWVDIYWQDFIPLAHGIRLFGKFYNDLLGPEDPYEFMELLAGTSLLSVRRNRALEQLASRIREDTALREAIESTQRGTSSFEGEVESFVREHGGSVFEAEKCFDDRRRLNRLLISLADTPKVHGPRETADVQTLTEQFFSTVPEGKQPLARELLDLGRASFRLRDDDNLHLARLETLVHDATTEAQHRHSAETNEGGERFRPEVERFATPTLRHPNLVVEPREQPRPATDPDGFRTLSRQLTGQPAGPGIATGAARVIRQVSDLYDFRAGEVLVCDAVDPNMTFVVPMAKAIVERRGGMLVHGAIIAREYGLPCVTGVPDAASSLSTGDRLTVDGYLGIVTVSRDGR